MDTFDDAFGSGGEQEVEVDPAAEFLAKEQQELGDIGEDLGLGAAPESTEEIQAFKDDLESQEFFTSEHQQPSAAVQDLFEPEIPVAASGPNYFCGTEEVQELSSGMGGMSMNRELPECLKKWKLEQEEMLKQKDADEEVRKEELRAVAAKELEDWYKHYDEQLQKTKKANKEHEQALETPEVNGITPGQEWERVSKHCDFSAKAPGHTKDVSRMRSILLQLKQNPPTSRE